DHLAALRRIIQRLVLIPEPDQLVLAVTFADVDAELDQRLIHHIPESIRLCGIGSALDCDRPLVIGITGSTPGAVLLFHVQADTSVLVDAVITGCFCGGFGKPVSKSLYRTLAHHAVRRDAVNTVRPLPRMIRTELFICHHRTICKCHYSSPTFPSVSEVLSWI